MDDSWSPAASQRSPPPLLSNEAIRWVAHLRNGHPGFLTVGIRCQCPCGRRQSSRQHSGRPVNLNNHTIMSTLVFVRHGQASLFSDNYDQLSEPGRQQSQDLGRYLQKKQMAFDELYVGPRQRHRDTASLADDSGGQLPEPVEVSEFDEHHVDQLVSGHLDELCSEFPYLTEMRNAFHAADTDIDRQRQFARLFEAVAVLWVQDACPLFGIESWPQFRERVNAGIDRIVRRNGSSRRVMVATSAGTIMAAMHRALQCPDEVALGLGWRIWNCSVTTFAFSGDRFTLDHFNSMAHVDDRALWTYR